MYQLGSWLLPAACCLHALPLHCLDTAKGLGLIQCESTSSRPINLRHESLLAHDAMPPELSSLGVNVGVKFGQIYP